MRVLGIDPGLTRCGLGVVDGSPGQQVRSVAHDVARTPADMPLDQRLLRIGDEIEWWLDTYAPDAMAVERVFSQHNVKTVMGTAQVSGIAMLLAARRHIPAGLHTPSEVKAAVTGSGQANKDQVTQMVTRILRLDAPPKPADAADALALATCHIWRGPATNRLAEAAAGARSRGPAPAAPATSRPGRPVATGARAPRVGGAG